MAKGTMELCSDISFDVIEKGVGDNHGRAPERNGAKARTRSSSSSVDMVEGLETRVVRMEIALGDVRGTIEDISVHRKTGIGELEVKVQELKSNLGVL